MESGDPSSSAWSWQTNLVGTIRDEIDQGRSVRVSLPGLPSPVLIEDAERSGIFVALLGPEDSRFFIGDLQGLVILSDPQPSSVRWPKHAAEVSMDVDQDVRVARFNRSGELKRDGEAEGRQRRGWGP